MRGGGGGLGRGRRAVREEPVPAAGDARDRRQGADRGHRGLYLDLLVGGLQRHPAAEDLLHLSKRGADAFDSPPLPSPSSFRTNGRVRRGGEVCAMTTLETTPLKKS